MSIHKLQRVLWRLRKRNPNEHKYSLLELKRAIMYEIGTSPDTWKNNLKALKDLGWIKVYRGRTIKLTDEDLR